MPAKSLIDSFMQMFKDCANRKQIASEICDIISKFNLHVCKDKSWK